MPETLRHKPTKKELHLQRKKAFTRREFVKKLAIGGSAIAGLGIVGAVWQLGSRLTSPQETPVEKPETLDGVREQHKKDEAALARSIQAADQAMATLDKLSTPQLAKLPSNQINALRSPIDIYRNNIRNPNRNSYTFLLDDLDKRGENALKSPAALMLEDRSFFFMRLLEGRVNVAGTFSPTARTLHLSEDISSVNLFDAMMIYHECEHARQDSIVRGFLTSAQLKQKYDSFYTANGPSDKPRVLVLFEYQAYAKEIEFLNLLTDGKLKQDSQTGVFNIEEYRKRLNALPNQTGAIDMILRLGQVYYSTGSSLDSYSKAFSQKLNQNHSEQGYNLYTLTNMSLFEVQLIQPHLK